MHQSLCLSCTYKSNFPTCVINKSRVCNIEHQQSWNWLNTDTCGCFDLMSFELFWNVQRNWTSIPSGPFNFGAVHRIPEITLWWRLHQLENVIHGQLYEAEQDALIFWSIPFSINLSFGTLVRVNFVTVEIVSAPLTEEYRAVVSNMSSVGPWQMDQRKKQLGPGKI